MQSQASKIILAIIITSIVAGSGVYFWRTNKGENAVILTKDYLVSSEWGQAGDFGMQIKFNTDGTFYERFAGETDDIGHGGIYEIKGNGVTLKVNKYGGYSFEEAKKIYGTLTSLIPDRTLTLEKTYKSLYNTDYLANDDAVIYWNRSSKLPEGTKIEFNKYVLVATGKNLIPKPTAKAKLDPLSPDLEYSFERCDPNDPYTKTDPQVCDVEPHKLTEVVDAVLARTQRKEEYKGVEDYWYLVSITVPWYSVALLDNAKTSVSSAWVHGSELE